MYIYIQDTGYNYLNSKDTRYKLMRMYTYLKILPIPGRSGTLSRTVIMYDTIDISTIAIIGL